MATTIITTRDRPRVIKIAKQELITLNNPLMSLCFSPESLNIIKFIKTEYQKKNNDENGCLLGVQYPKQRGKQLSSSSQTLLPSIKTIHNNILCKPTRILRSNSENQSKPPGLTINKIVNEQHGDIQFVVTGHIKKSQGKFIETVDEATRREILEELGIWVNGNIRNFRFEALVKKTKERIHANPQNISPSIIMSSPNPYSLPSNINSMPVNVFFPFYCPLPPPMPMPIQIYSSPLQIHSSPLYYPQQMQYINQHNTTNRIYQLVNNTIQMIPNLVFNNNYNYNYNYQYISHLKHYYPQFSSNVINMKNTTNLDEFEKNYIASNQKQPTILSSQTNTLGEANTSLLTHEESIKKYTNYIIPISKCVPLRKKVTLTSTSTSCQQNIQSTDKICSYVYGSKKEIEQLISNVEYVVHDKDNIIGFVIIKLNDVIDWLSAYEALNYIPRSIHDKNLKTNFQVQICNYTKCLT